ncbi:hypothetical protein [Pontimicrobium sp. MEBiC01747]
MFQFLLELRAQYNYYRAGGNGMLRMQQFRNHLSNYTIDYDNHYYTNTIDLGEISEENNALTLYRQSAYGRIGQSVPGAILGGDRRFFGNRISGQTVNASFGGPVRTINNDENLEMLNIALPGHVFGGTVRILYYNENGRVYRRITGEGRGNFSRFNNHVGQFVFTYFI